jgi:predicted esterase
LPQTAITAEYPPTYLLAGSGDTSVPHGETVHISGVLEKHGVEHTLNLMEGKDHLLDQEERDQDVQRTREEIMAFLESKW